VKAIIDAERKRWLIVGAVVVGLWLWLAGPVAAQTVRPVDVPLEKPAGAFLPLVDKGAAVRGRYREPAPPSRPTHRPRS
jgi:hypothetical protein